MLESRYLTQFQRLQTDGAELFQLRGNRLLVEILPEEEIKTESGLIMAKGIKHARGGSIEEHKATIALVVYVGKGYFDDDTGEDVAMDVKPGDIILLSPMGLKFYSTFPGLKGFTQNTLAMTTDDNIHAIIPGLVALDKVKGLLNG
jgi:co-chaperonin GroES (HSP10)